MSNKPIHLYSNPTQVRRLAKKYLGKTAKISLSTKKEKKYMVITPNGMCILGKWDTKTSQNIKIKRGEKTI